MDLPAGKGSFTHLLQGIESDFGCALSLVLCDNLGPIFFSKEKESFDQNSSFILRTIDKDSDNI